jgi:hypothetical protein
MSADGRMTQALVVSPGKVRGSHGDFQVVLRNTQKQSNTYQLKAPDPTGLCDYKFNKETLTLEADGTATVVLAVRFKKTPIFGASKVCDFTVVASSTTNQSIQADGQLECPSRLPIWALATGGIVIIGVIAIVVVLANKGNGSAYPQSNGLATKPANTSIANFLTTPVSGSITQTQTPPAGTPTITNPKTSSVPTTSTASTATTTSIPVTKTVALPNLGELWAFAINVTHASGVCSGEGGMSTDEITITQDGEKITFAGFQGSLANQLTGKLTPPSASSNIHWVVDVAGSYPEDGGITTSRHVLEIMDNQTMSGKEYWEWSGSGGTCPDGGADVTATKKQ